MPFALSFRDRGLLRRCPVFMSGVHVRNVRCRIPDMSGVRWTFRAPFLLLGFLSRYVRCHVRCRIPDIQMSGIVRRYRTAETGQIGQPPARIRYVRCFPGVPCDVRCSSNTVGGGAAGAGGRHSREGLEDSPDMPVRIAGHLAELTLRQGPGSQSMHDGVLSGHRRTRSRSSGAGHTGSACSGWSGRRSSRRAPG